jgi:hypothetical protein
VRHYFANPAALQAARDGQAAARRRGAVRRGALGQARRQQAAVTGADGFYVRRPAAVLHRDGARSRLGQGVPEMLRNEDWNYAVFTTAKQQRAGVNQAECLACHKPLDKTSYTFTLEQLTAAARAR